MIKTVLFCFAFELVFASNFASTTTIECKTSHNCPGHIYMTESVFNSDFYYSIRIPDSTLLETDRISYFYHLYDYSPYNAHGSCGYVSFAQYLSYYDCFYNDNIIPEVYERNQGSVSYLSDARLISPGVVRQSYPESSYDLFSFINSNLNSDYQMKLMYIVNESVGHDQNNYSCSIGMWDYYRIVNTIAAFDNTSYSFINVSFFGNSAKPTDANVVAGFDSYVKNLLDDGSPVMLHIAQYNQNTFEYNNYHSVVAYYYDEDGIHANFGWGSDSTDVVIPSNYQITEAGAIDFDNVTETHSNNFIVNYAGYCGCGLHTMHNHCDHYEQYSSTRHKAYCTCGNYYLEGHTPNMANLIIVAGHRYAPCIHCGTTIDLGGGGPYNPGLPDSNNQPM